MSNEIEGLKLRIDQLDSLVQSYKGMYYEQREENERLRKALARAVNDVETHCDKSDEPEWTQQAREALGND